MNRICRRNMKQTAHQVAITPKAVLQERHPRSHGLDTSPRALLVRQLVFLDSLPSRHVCSHFSRPPGAGHRWLPTRPPRLRQLTTLQRLQSRKSGRPPREAPHIRSPGRGLRRHLLAALEAPSPCYRQVPHCLDVLGGFMENCYSVGRPVVVLGKVRHSFLENMNPLLRFLFEFTGIGTSLGVSRTSSLPLMLW